MPRIISNTTCLIVLDNLNLIHILKDVYKEIYITEEVHKEFGNKIEDWIKIKDVKNKNYTKLLNTFIDLGESSTIALSYEINNSIMILDDLKARKIAKSMNLKYTGTLGVLLRAKEKGIISSVKPIMNQLKLQNFFISESVEKQILMLAKENN